MPAVIGDGAADAHLVEVSIYGWRAVRYAQVLMKILWVGPQFLHPTTKGGHIRTLEMLRHLHRWHEIHYLALEKPEESEGVRRSPEYSSRAYPIPLFVPVKGTPAFLAQAARNVLSALPLAVSRYRSPGMRRKIEELLAKEKFDRMVCDFLFPAPNIPDLSRCVLFQHNVEAMIWKRHYETATNPFWRVLFRAQSRRMLAYEGAVCRSVASVIAVSEKDAQTMRELYGITRVDHVPTGVDFGYFTPSDVKTAADLVFVGSMDWMPNVEGITWFLNEVLPLVRRGKPDCSVAIVGRTPPASLSALAGSMQGVEVTGTVPDIRPYLWGSRVSVVPLRIGGGTRLKIFESMAAKVPVVSTTIGAEGLPVNSSRDIFIADTPEEFSRSCLDLLGNEPLRKQMAQSAWDLVSANFSWERASRRFEELLLAAPPLSG